MDTYDYHLRLMMEVDGGYFWAEQLFSSHEYWDDDYDYEDYFRDGEEFVFEIHTPSSTGQPEDFSTPRYEVDQDCGSPCEGTIESETVAFSECPVITAPRQVNWVQSRLVIRNVRCIDVTSPRQGPDVSASTDSRFLPPLRHISLGQFVSLFLLPLHPNKFVDSEQYHFPYRDRIYFGYTSAADYGEYGGLLAAPAHTEESNARMSRGYDSLHSIVGPDIVSKADTKVDLELRIAQVSFRSVLLPPALLLPRTDAAFTGLSQ